MKGGANKLTARTVASVKDPGRYSDGQNLYLVVDPSGAKRWVFMFRWRRPGQPGPGRSREMGLGSIHRVELKRARELASEARRLLGEGIDPIAARQNQRDVPTFQEAAEEWIQASKASVRSDSPRFYGLLDRHMPGWREAKEELDGLSEMLLAT